MGMSIFNIALDALLVVAIVGLWVVWFQQAGQRKKVESMLLQASKELQEATTLLDRVMGNLADQKVREEKVQQQVIEEKTVVEENKVEEKRAKSDLAQIGLPEHTTQKQTTAEPNYSAQVMRLNREGLAAEEIAEKLGVPIAQVRLLLLLQVPKV